VGIDAGGPEELDGLCVLGARSARGAGWRGTTHGSIARRSRSTGEAQKWLDFEADGDLTIVE